MKRILQGLFHGPRLLRWIPRLLYAVAVAWLSWLGFNAYAGLQTDLWWYESLGQGSVFSTILGAKAALFGIFGGLAAMALTLSLVTLYRTRPRHAFDDDLQMWRYHFNNFSPKLLVAGLVVAVVLFAITIGQRAAGSWQAALAWLNSTPWGATDSVFHRDATYFVNALPFEQGVVSMMWAIVLTTLGVTVFAAYWFGAVRIRGDWPLISKAFRRQLSALLGLLVLVQAGAFGLDRLSEVANQGGPVTGASFTDLTAVIPGRLILVVVALLCAVALLANVRFGSVKLAGAGLLSLALVTAGIGAAWPALVSRFQEQPSEASLDKAEIATNLRNTLVAFGLEHNVSQQQYGRRTLTGKELQAQASRAAQIRVLDPNTVPPTFNVKQQIEAYYGFKSTIDIDHYPLGGRDRDVALAARELRLKSLPRNTWENAHLVYTHGYGVVAALTDQLNEQTGVPRFINGGLPPSNQIRVDVPQIYFGQSEPDYSIVGRAAADTSDREFDHPSPDGATGSYTTYRGDGGVPIGSPGRRLLYALTLNSPNILLSNEVTGASRLLSVRDPRDRVAALAPWLTLDGVEYPIVVDGRVQWVVDGYTTSNSYPESQQINLQGATTSTLTVNGATQQQSDTSVNYIRNSVKAVVDAYTGEVRLYEWNQRNQPDPLLRMWERVFPGLVHAEDEIPAGVLTHLRYPQDLFNVQRYVLTRYHVTDPADFYDGNGFWKVPTDPTVSASKALNTGGDSNGSDPTLPSTYMSISADGVGPARYALSSPLVTLNQRDLAAFLSVNAQPGPDYGKFTLLSMPAGASFEAPAQVQNEIESSNEISRALTLQRGGNSTVLLGNLLTIPLGGRILYVEPVYTLAAGSNSFPVLRHVIAVYGTGAPAFEPTLDQAVREALRLGTR